MVLYKAIFPFTLLLIISLQVIAIEIDSTRLSNNETRALKIYQQLDSQELSFDAFSSAYKGYRQLLSKTIIEKKNILTVIDFNKSSKKERFFIIDLSTYSIIHESLVAHGKNSGWDIPSSFSNLENSHKSSLGFYVTGETYVCKHGLSLKLNGLEKGINDNARKRHIVIHAADYVSHGFVEQIGRLGRSFGCPALPSENYAQIIDLIKDKSIVFIYSNQRDYFAMSKYL